jgi:hypothetical protein
VSSISVNGIARYNLGKWYPLRQGLNGRVNSLLTVGACLYIGGTFTRTVVEMTDTTTLLDYATRWCIDLVADDEPVFEAIAGFDGIGPVKQMLHSTQNIHEPDEFICPLDDSSTHCGTPLKH